MTPFSPRSLVAVAAAFVLALLLTPLVRAFARRVGMFAAPKIDRWHKKPTAMLGGVAIWFTVIICFFAFIPQTVYGAVILFASTLLFIVGLVDDGYTTGATASACAIELRRAGARRVEVVCLARAVR